MAEPTEADRERAVIVVAHLPISLGDYRTRDLDAARDVIAQALADERERARAPFLALADDLDDYYPDEGDWDSGRESAFSEAADRIRRAAERAGQ